MKLKRKYLKNEEMLRISNYNHEVTVFDNAIEKERLRINILQLQIEKMQFKIQDFLRQKSNKRNELKNHNDEIKKLCGIKIDSWGFDPDSGEIKL